MSIGTIALIAAASLLILSLLMLIGSIPGWPHSRSWGYAPSGGLGLVLIFLIIFRLLDKI